MSSRAAQRRAVAEETAQISREKALFEALFRDLGEGAIVATPDNRVMLYNRMAQELLGDIGLDSRPQSREGCRLAQGTLRGELHRV